MGSISTIVIAETPSNVESLLAPYDKKLNVSIAKLGGDWFNPQGEWDFWCYGGHWDGAMQGEEVEQLDGFSEHNWSLIRDRNTCLVKDIAPRFIPYAALEPSGAWHDCIKFTDDAWKLFVAELFAKYHESRAYLCSLHS